MLDLMKYNFLRIRLLSLLTLSVALTAFGQQPTDVRTSRHTPTDLHRRPNAIQLRAAADPDSNPLFVPAVTYGSGGVGTLAVAVADLNGDSFPDMVLVNGCGDGAPNDCPISTVGVLLGNGDGTFQAATTYVSGGFDARWVKIGDPNGDGKLDLIVGNVCGFDKTCQTSSGSLGVLLGNGDGTFQPAVASDSDGYLVAPGDLADINGDGKLDFVAGRCRLSGCFTGTGIVAVSLGNGDGSFQATVNYRSGGQYPEAVMVADVNGDGKPDLIAVNCAADNGDDSCPGEGVVGVLIGKGDGTFKAAVLYNSNVYSTRGATVADVNGDGRSDILVAAECGFGVCDNGGEGGISVLLGNGNGTFQTAVIYGSGGCSADSVTVSDLNNDGKVDLLVAGGHLPCGSGDRGAMQVLMGNGDGTFQPATTYDTGGFFAAQVVAADVNRDGKPDAVASNDCMQTNNCALGGSAGVFLNDSPPHSPTTTTVVSDINPVTFRKLVTYTATVVSGYPGPVTGTVTFKDGTTVLLTVRWTGHPVTYSTSYSKVATHMITATYSGDVDSLGSVSASLAQYVQGTSKMTLTTSGSPSIAGQPVTFTCGVFSNYGAIPNGEMVTFYDGKTVLAISRSGDGNSGLHNLFLVSEKAFH